MDQYNDLSSATILLDMYFDAFIVATRSDHKQINIRFNAFIIATRSDRNADHYWSGRPELQIQITKPSDSMPKLPVPAQVTV